MNMGDKRLAFPKPTPRAIVKQRREKLAAKQERACREIVRQRDGGRCTIPGCKEPAPHQHHIVYRSKSKALKFRPENLTSLCVLHHQLVHAGTIQIERSIQGELVITGEVDALKFRL